MSEAGGRFRRRPDLHPVPAAGAGRRLPKRAPLPSPEPSDPLDAGKQPVALRHTVEYAHRETGKPVFVTQNGFQTPDDTRRAWYIPQVLGELRAAIAGGVPVIGYLHWSLIDNLEWADGFRPRYGLASVDRKTFRRTLKPSADVYRRIVRANAV